MGFHKNIGRSSGRSPFSRPEAIINNFLNKTSQDYDRGRKCFYTQNALEFRMKCRLQINSSTQQLIPFKIFDALSNA